MNDVVNTSYKIIEHKDLDNSNLYYRISLRILSFIDSSGALTYSYSECLTEKFATVEEAHSYMANFNDHEAKKQEYAKHKIIIGEFDL